uniref:Uncharacterized protein n=1 Tax=Lepeophtheirus salmonis TaxID=72036 RepID=A0A0K2V127_LEPSM
MKVQTIISALLLCVVVLSSVPETDGFFLGNFWCNVSNTFSFCITTDFYHF